jgi:hypothetical protein
MIYTSSRTRAGRNPKSKIEGLASGRLFWLLDALCSILEKIASFKCAFFPPGEKVWQIGAWLAFEFRRSFFQK